MTTRGSQHTTSGEPRATAAERVGVALRVPIDEVFHYAVPDELRHRLAVGHAVSAPFGRRVVTGVVLQLDPPPPPGIALRPLRALLLDEPVLDDAALELLRWTARYYRHPLGQTLAAALPPLLHSRGRRAGEGERPAALAAATVDVVSLSVSLTAALGAFPRPGAVRDRLLAYVDRFGEVEVAHLRSQFAGARRILAELERRRLVAIHRRRVAAVDDGGPAAAGAVDDGDDVELEDQQVRAVESIGAALDRGEFAPILLHGVTGSGKTEVYLRAARRALDAGGGVLVLVPEIALTPQLVQRFAARLRTPLVVLHSALTPRQRLDRWHDLRDGRVRVAIGARSAVFAPVRDLRLIVVDEEHDGSFKQDDGLRYHARDLAVKRASLTGCACVLGSATPALESLHNARTGRYRLLELPGRVLQRPMPRVEVVDLREHGRGAEESRRLLTPPLVEALRDTVDRGEQAILLLNRRGHATMVICASCGGSFRCPDCDVALTYHGRRDVLLCHWCGRAVPRPARCPHCQAEELEEIGEGTGRVEEGLAALLPGLRVDRMDRDTTGDRGAHQRILERFRSGEIQVLVGTQMVAKGHDFPRVTLVGVLHADAALHLPDFRSGERTFALLTQVAGRAGRAHLPGRVIVQTFSPDHRVIRHALQHDYAGHAERLLRARRALGYPPFGRLALIRVSHPRLDAARDAARALGRALRATLPASPAVRLLGPAPAPMPRIAGRYRWHLLLLASSHRALAARLDAAAGALERARGTARLRLVIDVDPQSLL